METELMTTEKIRETIYTSACNGDYVVVVKNNIGNLKLSNLDANLDVTFNDCTIDSLEIENCNISHITFNNCLIRYLTVSNSLSNSSETYPIEIIGCNILSLIISNFRDKCIINQSIITDLSLNDKSGVMLKRNKIRCATICNARGLEYNDITYLAIDSKLANNSFLVFEGNIIHHLNLLDFENVEDKFRWELVNGVVLTESMVVYKKAYINCLVPCILELQIPKGAILFSNQLHKCRTNKAKVLRVLDTNLVDLGDCEEFKICSRFDKNFTYKKGKTYTINNFDLRNYEECSNGIHCFLSANEAINYDF